MDGTFSVFVVRTYYTRYIRILVSYIIAPSGEKTRERGDSRNSQSSQPDRRGMTRSRKTPSI